MSASNLKRLPISPGPDQDGLIFCATARPRRSELGFPKTARRSESKALIRRRAGQCMDHILVS